MHDVVGVGDGFRRIGPGATGMPATVVKLGSGCRKPRGLPKVPPVLSFPGTVTLQCVKSFGGSTAAMVSHCCGGDSTNSFACYTLAAQLPALVELTATDTG